MKKFLPLFLLCITFCLNGQAQATHTVQLDQCHGTLNSPGTWGIPHENLESCRTNPANWTETDTEVCPDSIYTFIVEQDRTLIAIFEKIVGIETITNDELRIYPNPTSGELSSKGINPLVIEIFDVFGRKQLTIDNGQLTINISNLANGIYFVKITTETGVVTKKIIKQ